MPSPNRPFSPPARLRPGWLILRASRLRLASGPCRFGGANLSQEVRPARALDSLTGGTEASDQSAEVLVACCTGRSPHRWGPFFESLPQGGVPRSEEHTSELQSLRHLVCRL